MLRELADGLQHKIGRGNAERGFHEEGDYLRHQNERYPDSVDAPAALRNYYMTKLALIHSEATEAVEELRSGHTADETYYPSDTKGLSIPELYKPEGVPSEIADIVIRCFDFADEAGFSLIDILLEKLRYNDTRNRMHGKVI